MMVVSKLCVVLCVLAVSLFGGLERVSSQQHAPPPVDCSWRVELTTEIYDVPECMSFVNNGTQVHPEGHECCTWFQNIFFDKTNVNCLCEAFKSCTSQLGDVFNVTRAAALPAACGINDPSLVDCGPLSPKSSASPTLAPISGGAPAGAPGASSPPSEASGVSTPTHPVASSAPTGAPVTSPSGAASGFSAPMPAPSSASAISVSFGLFFIMVVVSCFCM